MKTISQQEHDLIGDVIAEGHTVLAEGILEKDLLLTQVLQVLAQTDTDGIGLVFCGGTCLSKAHRLIQRMSEDVDFKVVVPNGLSRTARSKRLSAFKKQLVQVLSEAGFVVPPEGVVARDENSYVGLNLLYQSRFAPVASLRPEIKVELIARAPVLPSTPLPVSSMLDELVGRPAQAVAVECIGVQETLAEKVLSFLRRTAEVRAGRNRVPYDDRLVRHLYDVHAIVAACPDVLHGLPQDFFVGLVAHDADQFLNQYPEFANDPSGQMLAVLHDLQNPSDTTGRDYQRFVNELVFGTPVSFEKACIAFTQVATALMHG